MRTDIIASLAFIDRRRLPTAQTMLPGSSGPYSPEPVPATSEGDTPAPALRSSRGMFREVRAAVARKVRRFSIGGLVVTRPTGSLPYREYSGVGDRRRRLLTGMKVSFSPDG